MTNFSFINIEVVSKDRWYHFGRAIEIPFNSDVCRSTERQALTR